LLLGLLADKKNALISFAKDLISRQS